MSKIRLLYVDDEEHNLQTFKAQMRRDFEVYTALSGVEGLEVMANNDIEVVLSDQRMPGMTGVDFFSKLLTIKPDPMRILVTGYTDIQTVIDAINQGHVFYYINKPWDENILRTVINTAYEIFDLRKRNQKLQDELREVNAQLEFMLRQKLLD